MLVFLKLTYPYFFQETIGGWNSGSDQDNIGQGLGVEGVGILYQTERGTSINFWCYGIT